MKRADIKVGESYRTDSSYPCYGARVKVLEFGAPRSSGYGRSRRNDGVRVAIERHGHSRLGELGVGQKTVVVATRQLLAPWTSADDDDLTARLAADQRVIRLRERLRGVPGVHVTFRGVQIDCDVAEQFLDKAGL